MSSELEYVFPNWCDPDDELRTRVKTFKEATSPDSGLHVVLDAIPKLLDVIKKLANSDHWHRQQAQTARAQVSEIGKAYLVGMADKCRVRAKERRSLGLSQDAIQSSAFLEFMADILEKEPAYSLPVKIEVKPCS